MRPIIIITDDMISEAKKLINEVKVNRTIASEIDTLTGILGEFVFAEYLYGDWEKHNVGKNKGESDFSDIEIKTSAFPFNERLNLLVREDYAKKRKPKFYVQIIIDVESRTAKEIKPNTRAIICGWATSEMVDAAPKRDMGSKVGDRGGYLSHFININDLNDLDSFGDAYKSK